MKRGRPLGQVFLKSSKHIGKIAAAADIANKTVVEIGAGSGRLTKHLIPVARALYCVEVDSFYCDFLRDRFGAIPKVKIIQSDITKFPLSEIGCKVVVCGNIPYQISKRIITYLVEQRSFILRAYLVVQKEFAQKLTASVSAASYKYISCFIQYHAQVRRLFDIPASAFFPIPKVKSSLIEITFYSRSPYAVKDSSYLFKLIRCAFSHRRKKIKNVLPLHQDSEFFLRSLSISPESRAEDISLKEYAELANALYPEELP